MYGINDYLEACYFRNEFLREQRNWLADEKQQHANDIESLENVLQRSRNIFAGYLIPEIGDSYLEGLETRLSCNGLIDIKRGFEEEFALVEERTQELSTMDEIVHYDQRISTAESSLSEVAPDYDRLKFSMSHWQSSKWFYGLNKRGYFEENYYPSFFNRFFDWRAVSFLMADIERKAADLKFDHPEPLKARFRELRSEFEKVSAEYGDRLLVVQRINGLHDEYQQLLVRPEELLDELYKALGEQVIAHLENCPNPMLMRFAAEDEAVNKYMQMIIGVRKQIQYLRELSVTRLDSRLEQNQFEMQKVERKINKLRSQRNRGKRKYYSHEDIEKMRNVKAEKWDRRRMKTEKLRKRIVDFDRYNDGSCHEDYLWWDLITKRTNGDDIYEVQEHRRKFPDWDHRTYRDPFEAPDDQQPVWEDAAEDLALSMSDDADALFDAS